MIISEQILLEYRCELEKLITLRTGMVAQNIVSVQKNISQTYNENDFRALANRIQSIRDGLINLGEK